MCENRSKYESLIEQVQDKAIDADSVVKEFTDLLNIAFTDPFFNIGMKDDKYELILTPEGNRETLLLLNYWRSLMPDNLLESWNVYTTKPAMSNLSHEVALEMHGQLIKLGMSKFTIR